MLILANRSGDGAQTRPAGIPSIRDAALERTSFEVGKLPSPAADASSARAAPVGTTIRYRLSKWGVVVFTVERKTTGRRSGAKCVAGPAPGAPCTS